MTGLCHQSTLVRPIAGSVTSLSKRGTEKRSLRPARRSTVFRSLHGLAQLLHVVPGHTRAAKTACPNKAVHDRVDQERSLAPSSMLHNKKFGLEKTAG
mmetsp:Transcript_28717/g.43453  ORF Transcript_28717/g.43453 Transcript_28717/m.43453 type:complete len:98 (-) Transcript_28717:79-372(-)